MSVVYLAWLSGVGLGPFIITFFMNGHFGTAFRLMIGMMAAVVIVAIFLPGKLSTHTSHTEPHRGMPHISRRDRIRTYLAEVNRSLSGNRLLLPAMFAQTFALGMLTPVLTIYATNVLALTQSQFRVLLIVGGAVTVGFMIPVGKMVDRWGTKWFWNAGFLLGAVSLLSFPFAWSMTMLYIVVLMLGSAYALIIPAWNALIASVIPPQKRGVIWGFFLTIEGLGTTIAPVISGKMWDVLGPHAPFMTSGCVLVVLFVLQIVISVKKRAVS